MKKPRDVLLCFVTGYPDFAAEGYEVAALPYLMKPVGKEKLSAVLDRASAQLGKTEKTVLFSVDGEMRRVKVNDIVYVEAFAQKCAVITVYGPFEVKMGISGMEVLPGEGFVRCHRSHLVSLRFIGSISKTSVALDGGKSI